MSIEQHEKKIAGVVQRFIDGVPQRVELIKNSITSANWSEAELYSHRLAGASLFGFPEIGQSAKRIENAIKDQHYSSLDTLITELDSIIRKELVDKNKSVLF